MVKAEIIKDQPSQLIIMTMAILMFIKTMNTKLETGFNLDIKYLNTFLSYTDRISLLGVWQS